MEHVFRSWKSVNLKIRPIDRHWADRAKADAFSCMLSYCEECCMRRALAPMLLDADHPQAAEAAHKSIVSPAERSPKAKRKDSSPQTDEGRPIHVFKLC